MEHRTHQSNEYALAAFTFSLLSLIGSLLSIFNIIPLLITYELLLRAKEQELSEHSENIISSLFEASLVLTLCTTVLYLSIQL